MSDSSSTSLPERVLITGAGGQLGQALATAVPRGVEILACDRASLDICDAGAVSAAIKAFEPRLLINAAAYTAVDKAESDPAGSFAVNEHAVGVLATAAREARARLLHVSTDFVFDGAASSPYAPDSPTAPLGVYGESKLAGEILALESAADCLVMRTGWVYAATGHNFMLTMLRLHRERDELRVVADQVGTPTAAHSLAQALWAAAARPDLTGIYHWSDAGVCSWYDFAVAIGEEAAQRELIDEPARVLPIATHEYPTPAQRPAYSVLDKSASWRDLDIAPVHWRTQLGHTLDQLL